MSLFLAIDGGSTQTSAGLYNAARRLLAEDAAGPSNPILVGPDVCVTTLLALAKRLLRLREGTLQAVAAGISGAGKPVFAAEITRRLRDALNGVRTTVTDDVWPLLYANAGTHPAVAVVAGTGSSIAAQAADGRLVRIGGRGSVFGDDGSAYQVAVRALRAAADAVDGLGPATALTAALPQEAGVSTFADLPAWTEAASKRDIANLARAVARLADQGDAVATACLIMQADRLADQAAAISGRLSLPEGALVLLHGALFEHCPRYRTAFEAALVRACPGLRPRIAPLRGHRAVVELALADEEVRT